MPRKGRKKNTGWACIEQALVDIDLEETADSGAARCRKDYGYSVWRPRGASRSARQQVALALKKDLLEFRGADAVVVINEMIALRLTDSQS